MYKLKTNKINLFLRPLVYLLWPPDFIFGSQPQPTLVGDIGTPVLALVLEPLCQVDNIAAVRTEGQGEEDRMHDDGSVHLLSLHADLAVDGGVGDVQEKAAVLFYPDLSVAAGAGAGDGLHNVPLSPDLPPHLRAVVLLGVDGGPVVNVDVAMRTFVQRRSLTETDPLQHLIDLLDLVIEALHDLLDTGGVNALMVTGQGTPHCQDEEADQERLGDKEVHPDSSRLRSLTPGHLASYCQDN